MKPPAFLKNADAKAFWRKHAKPLADAGSLSERDTETFTILAEIWGMIRGCDPASRPSEAVRYIGLIKQYQNFVKQFGLMPKDRRQSNLEPATSMASIIAQKISNAQLSPGG